MFAETRRQSEANAANDRLSEAYEELATMRGDVAWNVAVRCAIEAFVRRLVGPEHPVLPILDDEALRERIGNNGLITWNNKRDWDAVKDYGRGCNQPPAPDLLKNYIPVETHKALGETHDVLVKGWTERGISIQRLNAEAIVKDEAVTKTQKTVDILRDTGAVLRRERAEKDAEMAKLQETVLRLRGDNEALRKERTQLNQVIEGHQVQSLGKDAEIQRFQNLLEV